MWLPQQGYEIQAESVKIGDFQPMYGDIFEMVQDRALDIVTTRMCSVKWCRFKLS